MLPILFFFMYKSSIISQTTRFKKQTRIRQQTTPFQHVQLRENLGVNVLWRQRVCRKFGNFFHNNFDSVYRMSLKLWENCSIVFANLISIWVIFSSLNSFSWFALKSIMFQQLLLVYRWCMKIRTALGEAIWLRCLSNPKDSPDLWNMRVTSPEHAKLPASWADKCQNLSSWVSAQWLAGGQVLYLQHGLRYFGIYSVLRASWLI